MGREESGHPGRQARRLAVAAGSVLAAAVSCLPFAGGAAERAEGLTTVAGFPSGAEVAAADAARPPLVVEPPRSPSPAAVAPAPPEVAPPAPPPPPPPPPTRLDPTQGVVAGNEAVQVPVVVAPPAPSAPSPEAAAVPASVPGSRVWAVVIGIDDYPGTRYDLRAAAADGRDLVTALVRFGVPADHIRSVYDRAASVESVLEAVAWLTDNAGPDDTAVFLYAGHVRDLGAGTEAIVTSDNGWITDWFLAERFGSLRARDAWFVVAGCYGGGFDELLAPGRVLTAAAGPGELAYESEGYGRSYLAEFLLRRALLEGAAGVPTVQSAVAWATDELSRQHPDRQLWHRDDAGHVVSLDGVRRGGAGPAMPPDPPPPPEPEPGGQLIDTHGCLLGLFGSCSERRNALGTRQGRSSPARAAPIEDGPSS